MPRNTDENAQSTFLNQVKNRLPENISLVDELAELLAISRDSAYRRIRGETVLSLDEVKKLYDKYGTSVDMSLSSSSNMALFHHRALTDEYGIDRWLSSVAKNLQRENSFEEKQIVYAAKDIPIFHYFRFPELAAFKMFFWEKTLMKNAGRVNEKFGPDAISKDLIALGQRVCKLYSTIPSIEIWSDECINDTLKQIVFYRECDFFATANIADLLYDQMLLLLDTVKGEAEAGKKTDGADYQLYQNEIWIADNTVFAKMGNKQVVYVNYNTLNLLTTLQSNFCKKTEAHMNNLVKNSTLISSTAEKERNKFFNKLVKRIEATRSVGRA